jgi:hypothetical protein
LEFSLSLVQMVHGHCTEVIQIAAELCEEFQELLTRPELSAENSGECFLGIGYRFEFAL